MSFSVEVSDDAALEIKRLSKKYRSFKEDFGKLLAALEELPVQGEPLGKDCFKIHLAISAKNKGKSGGARVITCVKIMNERVVILSAYDKSEADTVDNEELKRRLKNADLI